MNVCIYAGLYVRSTPSLPTSVKNILSIICSVMYVSDIVFLSFQRKFNFSLRYEKYKISPRCVVLFVHSFTSIYPSRPTYRRYLPTPIYLSIFVRVCVTNRTMPPPNLPPGKNERLSGNAYYSRDARRDVEPDKLLGPAQHKIAASETYVG